MLVRRMLVVVFSLSLAATAAEAKDQPLRLRRVMLSSAGVGYFEYGADVDGATTLGLDVLLKDVDDVLKSLTVFDSNGRVGNLELPSLDSSHVAFGDVPFGPDALNSPIDLLNSLQGVTVAVAGPRPMSGRILRAERVQEVIAGTGNLPERIVDRTRVSLLTADGLRQFTLEDVDAVTVADPALRDRIERAVAATRQQSGQDSRHISIASTAAGKRSVRVGYVAGAPLWKASYRLVLPAESPDVAQAKARLQGWATFENVSGENWDNVDLSLHSGDPVTFRQAIYRIYFVERPEVPVEVLGRILPNIDTRARTASESAEAAPPAISPAPAAPGEPLRAFGASAARSPVLGMKIAQPAEAAEVSEGAEETLFKLATPLTLAAGHSASIPILDSDLPAERIDLAQSDQPHPFAAVKVTNTSSTSLPAGVLTLYSGDGATFAGDARLGGLPAGESRLLSFATDLRTSLEWRHGAETTIAAVTAAAGVLRVDERDRRTTTVAMTAPAGEPRRVLVEIPKGSDQTIGTDGAQPTEQTATAWRFAVNLKPGETNTLVVHVDHLRRQATALVSDASIITRILNQQGLGPDARAALRGIETLRANEAAHNADRARLIAQRDAVEADEARLRENLAAVPEADALHTRLVRQLDQDETKLGDINRAIDAATQEVDGAHQALVDAIGKLSI